MDGSSVNCCTGLGDEAIEAFERVRGTLEVCTWLSLDVGAVEQFVSEEGWRTSRVGCALSDEVEDGSDLMCNSSEGPLLCKEPLLRILPSWKRFLILLLILGSELELV